MLPRKCFPVIERVCRMALASGQDARPLVGRLRNVIQREGLRDPDGFPSREAAAAFLKETEHQTDSLTRLLRVGGATRVPTRASQDSIARLYRMGGLKEGHMRAADDLRRAHVLLTAPVQTRSFRYEVRQEDKGMRRTPHDYTDRQLDCIGRYRQWTDAMAERRLDHLKAWRENPFARLRSPGHYPPKGQVPCG